MKFLLNPVNYRISAFAFSFVNKIQLNRFCVTLCVGPFSIQIDLSKRLTQTGFDFRFCVFVAGIALTRGGSRVWFGLNRLFFVDKFVLLTFELCDLLRKVQTGMWPARNRIKHSEQVSFHPSFGVSKINSEIFG